ncbi:MAG: 23S rRNA (guanosine(2251)-2'-O)-methyltransferase RlmB [Clostridia bacterium]|nr:23S rRNA (guanosine(2251)-2'-O)-methyltransferase RlmB [Clostridia bacterium]MBO5777421.1 23S rRNA (guanosine(2251)-2'-O)-methyltransferase RlmB [Clostridia bacterium]MBO7151308.1 23S rRNA (guanosine(2251)-2'-O)-methyltransferase RlmB [Clostridia bacterium]MBO7222465.1 23S rRNA (guanosine(2251)-2'-O)-methyltransferase RlmB [Clostridia bacterium]MBR5173713.1 23S rRNA (guanosine(2251)-2'-O)-methyltransferase RlmB [Clostridia bacterium]
MIIYGRNPVKEAYRAGKTIEKLYLPKGAPDPVLSPIYKMAKEKRTVISYVDKFTMDKLSEGGNHQGVLAQITDFDYCTVEDILALAKEKEEDLLIVLLDGITDPHNLGAIVRSAECFGAHGIVIPKHRSVGVNDTVVKVASGATEHMLIAKVTNINDTIRMLKEHNVWVYATDFDGKAPKSANLTGNTAIVIGSEGEGIKKLTKELCDDTLTIPEYGKINSLNASVATGIILYEVVRQRH